MRFIGVVLIFIFIAQAQTSQPATQAKPAANATEQASKSAKSELDELFAQKLQNAGTIANERDADSPAVRTKTVSSLVLEMALALMVVLGLVFVLVWLLKKFNVQQMDPASKVVSEFVRPLGNTTIGTVGSGQRISLVAIDNKVLVLGVTENQINTLDILEGEDAQRIIMNTGEGVITSTQFSSVVNNLLSSFKRKEK
jgi:flagellar biogenesis protein FliO